MTDENLTTAADDTGRAAGAVAGALSGAKLGTQFRTEVGCRLGKALLKGGGAFFSTLKNPEA
jgi:hypothetical protein